MKQKAEGAQSEDLTSSLVGKSSSSSSLGSDMDLLQTLPLEMAPDMLSANKETCPKATAEQKAEGMPIETVARPLVGVDKAPVLAAAAAELVKDAQQPSNPDVSEEFRRKQLNMRLSEKEHQEAERAAAKEAKKSMPKAEPKRRGRPRKTDDEPACEKAKKPRSKSKATAAPAKGTSEDKPVAETCVVESQGRRKKREVAEAVAATSPAPAAEAVSAPVKRSRRANKGDSSPDVDQTLVPEILKVMDRFKRQNYDKEKDTWHEQ